MDVHSLGYRTDLIFAGFDGKIIDHGDFLVVRTPTNPHYYWGNFLLFPHPPRAGDFLTWRQLFRQEIGGPPTYVHQTFGWDSPKPGEAQPFLEAGFHLIRSVVMTCNSPRRPTHHTDAVDVRPLETVAEKASAIENQVLCRDPGHEEVAYRAYRGRQMDRYGAMRRAGLGDWYGAFVGGRLVADLGLFRDGELGRYQSVETHPEFRRRGIAGTMVYEAGRQSMAKYGLKTLVIVAEDEFGRIPSLRQCWFRSRRTAMGFGAVARVGRMRPA